MSASLGPSKRQVNRQGLQAVRGSPSKPLFNWRRSHPPAKIKQTAMAWSTTTLAVVLPNGAEPHMGHILTSRAVVSLWWSGTKMIFQCVCDLHYLSFQHLTSEISRVLFSCGSPFGCYGGKPRSVDMGITICKIGFLSVQYWKILCKPLDCFWFVPLRLCATPWNI